MDIYKICKSGDIEKVKSLQQGDWNGWNNGLRGACRGGHMDIVKLMIEKGANSWNGGFCNACRGENFEIAKLMIEKGAVYNGKDDKFNNYIEIEHGLEPLLPEDLVRMVIAR